MQSLSLTLPQGSPPLSRVVYGSGQKIKKDVGLEMLSVVLASIKYSVSGFYNLLIYIYSSILFSIK